MTINGSTVAPTVPSANLYFQEIVMNQKFAIIRNLSHFTEYTIEVRACHDNNPDPKREKCSLKAITSVRTLPLSKHLIQFA